MKQRLIMMIAAVIIALAGSSLKAEDRMFGELSKTDGCTSIYVGETLLKLVGDKAGNIVGDAGGINTAALIDKLTSVEVITCENSKKAKEISRKIEATIAAMQGLTVMAEVKDDESNIVIYAKKQPGSEFITTLIINVTPDDDPTVVALNGSFTTEDIAAVMGGDSSILDNF